MTPAEEFARTAHQWQTRRDNVTPYTEHLKAVANAFPTDSWEHEIAWLHDVLEDTPTSEGQLRENFDGLTVDAVVALTKKKGQSYEEYLEQVSQNDWAVRVKLVDIAHNLSDNPTPRQVEKYAKAIRFLAQRIDFGQK